MHNYISTADHGGLKYPHNDVKYIVMLNYIILEKLISAKYGYMHRKNQRYLVMSITKSQLREELQRLDVCDEGLSVEMIITKIIRITTNILLKKIIVWEKNDVKKTEPI